MKLRALSSMIMLLGLPVPTRAQEAVPVHREPRHRLVVDSSRFRVLDVRIPAGDTTRFHIHDTAILYVDIGPSPTLAQNLGHDWPSSSPNPRLAAVGNVRMDSSYVQQPVTHRVTNAGPGTFRLLAITSAGATSESGRDGPRSLPGEVELRSSWFQQARVHLPSGSMTAWFTSASPVLVVQPLASRIVVECDGDPRHALQGAGGWFLVPARGRCRIHNEGPETATALAIEIR